MRIAQPLESIAGMGRCRGLRIWFAVVDSLMKPADIAQAAERILGKDEVTSSNLVISLHNIALPAKAGASVLAGRFFIGKANKHRARIFIGKLKTARCLEEFREPRQQ